MKSFNTAESNARASSSAKRSTLHALRASSGAARSTLHAPRFSSDALRSPLPAPSKVERLAARASSDAPRFPLYAPRASRAFTLVEVMLVIGIIAILAALMFPVMIGANKKARERQALAESKLIFTAINAYRQEYNKWPAQRQSANDTTYINSNSCVILPLIGSNWGGFNPKNKIFLPLQTNSLDFGGNYLDPWGSPYVICMDENDDKQLSISKTVIYTNQISGIITISANQVVADYTAGAASLGGTTNTLSWYSWQQQ